MANEYLQRTPTSTGNRKVWTWSGWVKLNKIANQALFSAGTSSPAQRGHIRFNASNGSLTIIEDSGGYELVTTQLFRDFGSWQHILCAFDSTQGTSSDRIKLYANGIKINSFTTSSYPSINFDSIFNQTIVTANGNLSYAGNIYPLNGELTDIFFIDGQALTPDVFGFYKDGNGYISAGSTQATDFRPGQWVPKTPRVIKAQIERNGGFGVNGFYLPMNDSSNFGADFHCEPNSIITLKGEDLPQPRNGAPTTTDAYVSQLRTDPYAANLVLALPFVSSGLCTNGTNVGINTGFGDYSAIIKGSGSAKVGTLVGNVSIANTAAYYGSSGFFDGTDDRFTLASSSDFNFGTGDFTVEFWANSNNVNSTGSPSQLGFFQTSDTAGGIKASYTGGLVVLQGAGPSGGGIGRILAKVGDSNVGTDVGILTTGQWNHIALARKSGTATLYVNGVAVGVNTTATESITGTNLVVGGYSSTSYLYQGYLQDFRVYNTAKYKGGFDVPKPYTPVGIGTWRAVPDTTANNFATWNPLDAKNASSISNGNLSTGIFSQNYGIRATVGVSTDKWYWEWREENASPNNHHGIWAVNTEMSNYYVGQTTDSWGIYVPNGNKRNNTSFDAYGSAFSQGDIGMCALDKTNGKIWWGKNGTWFASGNPASGSNEAFNNVNTVDVVSPTQLQYEECSYNFGQNPTFSGNTTAGTFTDSNGKGLFKYEPPSGFLALCEDNLPTPAIKNPGEYFKTVLYRGDNISNGVGQRAVSGVGFRPDLVWIKCRNYSQWHVIYDSVRGFSALNSNTTAAEAYGSQLLGGYNEDGFTTSANNDSNYNLGDYTAWCWRAGAGTTSTNTDGSIQSVVSVNQDAGFSIVSYTGDGSDASVGHGLGKTPGLIIIKGRQTSFDWRVWHLSFNTGYDIQLNTTLAVGSAPTVYRASPTSSVVNIGSGTAVNGSGSTYIAYCWAEIEGFSKFGSYVGNGSADGPFVYTGGRPAFVMIKRTDSTGEWWMYDNARGSTNPIPRMLLANSSGIENEDSSSYLLDFLSNGFKWRSGLSASNASGGTYIYACFMESPFTTANSK